MRTPKDLDIWKLGLDLVEQIYSTTKLLPDDEKFGLSSQLRRSGVSVPLISQRELQETQIKNIFNFASYHWALCPK